MDKLLTKTKTRDGLQPVDVTPNNKIKVLMLYIAYPFCIASYFRRALERRDDIDLKVTGPYTGNWIPWMGGLTLDQKYAKPIDLPLPFAPTIGEINYELVKAQLGEWKPDIIINVDAGIHWKNKPTDGIVVTVGTDPHVLNELYDAPRKYSDKFFNMQKVYSKDGDIYLPYAYDPETHKPTDIEKDSDAVLIGMPYAQRIQWVNELRAKGCSVLFENGPVFDEYREINNRARIGLNWSSLDDLNARAFELAAMKLAPVMNVVTDLEASGIECATFRTLPEAIEAVMYLKENDDKRKELAGDAYRSVQGQTYDSRVSQIFKEVGLE